MTASIQDQTGVAIDAAHWDVGSYRIWESTDPDLLLYARHDLRLARDATGRPFAAITRIERPTSSGSVTTGGSAVLGFLGAEPDDPAVLQSLQDSWTRVVRASGYRGTEPRYHPLPIRDAVLTAELDPAQATVTAGSTGTTLQIDLTAAGAAAWADAVTAAGPVAGTVRLSYAYPQLMRPATAVVQVHGREVYMHLAAVLTVGDDGEVSGTAAEIAAAWSELARVGAIEVTLSGSPASALSRSRDNLVEQVRENLFDTMFVVRPAPTGGPATYALRWKRAADVPDLPLTVSVEGWTWLTESLETSVAQLLSRLDGGAVTTTYTSVSLPVTVLVDGCSAVETVGVSLDFGDVRPPEVVTVDGAGGCQKFTVTTNHPHDLAVRYRARIDFTPAKWPVVTLDGTAAAAAAADGGLQVIVKPDSWLRNHAVYLYRVVNGQAVTQPWDDRDVLTLNFRYEDPALAAPITDSAKITPDTPVRIDYPAPPDAPPGRATLSVLGMVGGQLLRESVDLVPADETVDLLLEDGRLRFVTPTSTLSESDPVGQRLREAGDRPVVRREIPPSPEGGQDLDVSLDVTLVPQPTTVSCWVASLVMVVSARDQISIAPETVAAQAGMDVDTSYAWPQIRQAVAAWRLVEEGPRSSPPAEWAALLREWGPIWVVEVGAPYHAVVVGGMSGDGTPDGTRVQLYNPWPPQVGAIEWKTFSEFDQEFGLGAGSGAAMVHANV